MPSGTTSSASINLACAERAASSALSALDFVSERGFSAPYPPGMSSCLATEPLLAVEEAQPLRHVVERGIETVGNLVRFRLFADGDRLGISRPFAFSE